MPTENLLPSIEYRKILYTTDLSEAGRYAFPYAASIARRFGSELTVFHVVESRDFEKYVLGYVSEAMWKELKTRSLEEARQLLVSRKRDDVEIRNSVQAFCDETLSRQTAGGAVLSYDVKVQAGEAVEEILREAHSGGYDLVVISKHGHRTSVKDAVIGDTARRVIRRCRVPVMVVQLPD
jgi:nucleotide-binding universal stress UspA family protein